MGRKTEKTMEWDYGFWLQNLISEDNRFGFEYITRLMGWLLPIWFYGFATSLLKV
jgi:hypothetical protein